MIEKIDNDTFKITNKQENIVKLSELEEELRSLELKLEEANQFNDWVDSLPIEKKKFIEKQYVIIPQELINQIDILKEVV